jgi:hypothetical protein
VNVRPYLVAALAVCIIVLQAAVYIGIWTLPMPFVWRLALAALWTGAYLVLALYEA